MKNILSLFTIIFLLFFLSACSLLPQRQVQQRSLTNQTPKHSQARQKPQQQSREVIQQRRAQKTRQQARFTQPKIARQNSRVRQVQRQSPVSNISPARQRIVNIAKTTLGVPYKWGGNSPQSGFDCSGLMSYVHKNAIGMRIPRVTAQQRDKSRTINYSQLQPGDMLFFKTGKRTNHVGVYIGDRKFIHAPASGKHVTVATMDSSYWHKRFVKFGTFL